MAYTRTGKEAVNKGGRRIAVIGDITGAGIMQSEINKKVAKAIKIHSIDMLVLYGNEAKKIKRFLNDCDMYLQCIMNRKQLEIWLKENTRKNDIILLKDSSKMCLDEITGNVYGLIHLMSGI